VLITLLVSLFLAFSAPRAAAPDHVTVPLLVEGNRPYIDLTFHRADGSARTARFLVDSGGGGFILVEKLARDLGVTWGKTSREEGREFGVAMSPPSAFLVDLPLDLTPDRVVVIVGEDNVVPKGAPGHAEGMFPGHLLAKYHVVFDYPAGQFTLAKPGVLTPKGDALAMPVSSPSGFPRTEVEIAGHPYGFLVDTGASFTMVSDAVLKQWSGAHPDWPVQPGAVGEAKTLGGQTLATIQLPGATWGRQTLATFGMVSQREGVFERNMSRMMTAPIVGSLAGNVLKHFRLELDYPNQKLYLQPR
jgi:predicted aspartyl protease